MMKEQLRIADLCQKIGCTIEAVRQLLKGITLSITSGKLYSPEHKQYFEVKEAKVKIEKEPDNQLRLVINGINLTDWFKQKYKEIQQKVVVDFSQALPKDKRFRL